ncbi:PREDICTED: uncharacterized protein LOC109466461 [Branchiostoma belcheri]|uniref:Uncharacterized protein LOC109466461 n=1 Tax=Branchiostoma belcheri TaxID=7741 RepID=A0A6P4XSW3_BRABE|nr:PREDICTED: uncharacterized protein LOC109466461 [Branchiostoma belcheri]
MLRVCEKLREADEKGRRYGLARAETGYLRALVDAMADTDRLAEVELLKTLGDVNVEKGRLGKDEGKFNTALAIYIAAMVRCYHEEQADGIEHRYYYTERLLQGLSSQGKEQPTEDKETTTPAKVAAKFQALDKRRATGGNTDSLLVGYAQVMVEAIVNDNDMLETEAIKSLGDVYLKRGTETGDTRDLTRATALYNRALARCHNVHGTVVIVHRLLHTAKIRQDITRRNKKQQGFRGRKGHFSALSAAPSSDGTTCQVDNDISYRRYIHTADRDLGNGDLDAAEQNLVAASKLVHDRSKPNKAKEADCLYRLGDVYVERGKRTGEGRKFTQAAALYNASMARTDGDKQNMVSKLQETERRFLRNTCNLDCEPCPYSSALDHIKKLDNSRARANSQLEAVHEEHNPYQYDEDDPVVREVEIKRAEKIKNLFKTITVERREFIQVLTDECIAKLGPPPCKYAFIGMGSQATELVTPYSDLEFAILIEEGKDDDDDIGRYFLNLTHYLHLKVINLGETILPAMAIPSLNDFLSEDPEKNWFYDSVTPRGFAFDGFMPWASKTPFGRDQTKNKPPVSLIQTPAKLAEYQNLRIALAEGYHLSDILRRVTYLTGDESLVDEYTIIVNKSVDRSPILSRLSAMTILKDNIREINNVEPTAQFLDVKKEIYRFPSVAVDVLSICCGITIASVWGMIEELHKTQRISHEDAHHLTVLISISAELRLRTYIANGGQKDRLSPLTEMKTELGKHDVDDTVVESVFHIPDSKMLFRYYYTAIPLKRCIIDTVKIKKDQSTKIFPTAIFDTSSQTRGRITQQLLQFNASRKAINYHEQSLKMTKAIYGETTPHPDIAGSLNNIGTCWSDLGDQRKATSYYEQSLKMMKAIYGETTPHPDIASSLNNIGTCWSDLGDQKKAIRYYEQSLKMEKAIYGETTPHPDIAKSLNNFGNCWNSLGDQKKAIRYYEQSLKMMKAIFGETTPHPDIARSLNNIGACWSDLGDQRKAISYYEKSLKMMKAIYGETTPHPDVAKSLHNVGNCWSDLGDQRKAIRYYEQSLKMTKTIYGETTPHPDIARSLNNIGKCWRDLGDQRKSISYYEKSLKMMKAIYGETTPHPDVAKSLHDVGNCWSDLGDQRKAIRYYEQSLKMTKTIYCETTPHPDIASSLNNVGKCWWGLGDQRKAIIYYEKSLKMRKAIYGETTPHPDIARSLSNIGACWSDLGDQRKAISYYEQSLKMRKAIYESEVAMLRVCEKLREADEKGRRYGLARAETGYLRALVDAMADTDRLAEVELLKTLGDVNVEKGRLGKDVGKFNTALALYLTAMVRCYHEEQADGIEHRYHYTERLLQGVSSQGKEQTTEDKETTTPAKVAAKFQALDKRRATGGNTDSLLVGYAQVMVEAIVNDNSMLETEAIKSLGDVYLKRGTETGDTRNLTRATALYNRALARCHNIHGTVVIVHRLLHSAKIRQDITRTKNKRSTRVQKQQDVRGRKGHFSAFSAAPSSDGTTSQVDDISYRRYIQTADRDVRNGDLDAAETNIAAALKLVHDRSKPNKAKEADCLSRLGDVYVERGKRTGEGRKFTQAAALYNASMARTDGDKQNMVTKLQETERQFLRNTCNLDCEPCTYSSALDHIKELDNLRARAKSQLETIHQEHNPYQYDEDDPVVRDVEIKRAEAIKNLFKTITFGRREFIQVLTDECIAKLGPPPCKYAFMGLGSQATELVTPYSDLEFAILTEEGKDDDDTRRYFINLTHYLHLKVINLGETILPAMAIPSLNDFLSEDPKKVWFYDSVTPRGFAFDGFMPWASKTPFGRDETKSKPPVSLIQTPAKLAKYQYIRIALAEGYHLSDILRRVTYLTGDESLVEEYTSIVNKSVDRSPALSRLSAMLILKDNIGQIENVEATDQLLDVKKEIYRLPSVAVDVLSICCGITIPSVWGMIEELEKTQRISHENAHHLTVLISISAELRLRTYIANGGQKDKLSPLAEMKVQLDKHDVEDTVVESVFHIPDSKMLFRYYYTAFPLKRCIMNTVKKDNQPTTIFPTAIFDNSS